MDKCFVKHFVVAFANPITDPIDSRILDVINIVNGCHYLNVFDLAVTKYYLLIFVCVVPSKTTDAVGLRRILCFLDKVISRHTGYHHMEWSDVCDVSAPPTIQATLDYRGLLEVVNVDAFTSELGSHLNRECCTWKKLRKIVVEHADTPKYYIERSNNHHDRAIIY